MDIVFLDHDYHTLTTRPIAHVFIEPEVDEDDGRTYYHATFFFLHGGMLTLATSDWAIEHIGWFVGVIDDHEAPESLRVAADRIAKEQLALVQP